jgi:poly-gamma-glutamate synthesis protein (capsule biosynthesis protein)
MIRLALCGDVMLGRGVDQILPSPVDPRIHERVVRSALGYVALAERVHGPIPRGVPFSYVWGDALAVLEAWRPDLFVVNLETAVTDRGRPLPKGINYRMSPGNLPVLRAAGIDCCVLANNHVLDWGEVGLLDTLDNLAAAGLRACGAGRDAAAAAAPAVFPMRDGRRVVVHGVALRSSGVPPGWAASPDRPGVNYAAEASPETADRLAAGIVASRRPGDITLLSVHWGGNWGYAISAEEQRFARRLIERAAIDVLHGHSSHHRKAIELCRGRPILYGAGDLLNDYEGIAGQEAYRGDLVLLYLVELDGGGGLVRLDLAPFRVRRFRLERAEEADIAWLRRIIDRECRRFGCGVVAAEGLLRLMPG